MISFDANYTYATYQDKCNTLEISDCMLGDTTLNTIDSVNSYHCANILSLDEEIHALSAAMALANITDVASTTPTDAQSEPTNWVAVGFKYKDIDSTYCSFLTNGYTTDMTTACLTDNATFVKNYQKPVCER